MDENLKVIYCNSCHRKTEHNKVTNFQHKFFDEIENIADIWWIEGWNIWQCGGCKSLTGEEIFISSEVCTPDGDTDIQSWYYPERNKETLYYNHYINIPDKIDSLYNEVITSYNNNCLLLCSIGLRTLIEGICLDKNVTGEKLYQKINNAQFIPENIRVNLHAFRFIGNDAAHELNYPSKEDLKLVISVTEDILNLVYELDYKSKLIYDKFNKKSFA